MAQVNFRIDDETKRRAESLFSSLGLTMSGAITIFIKQSLDYQGIPFAVQKRDPELEEFRKAIYDLEHDRKHWHYHDDDEMEKLVAEAEAREKAKHRTTSSRNTSHSRTRKDSIRRKKGAA